MNPLAELSLQSLSSSGCYRFSRSVVKIYFARIPHGQLSRQHTTRQNKSTHFSYNPYVWLHFSTELISDLSVIKKKVDKKITSLFVIQLDVKRVQRQKSINDAKKETREEVKKKKR